MKKKFLLIILALLVIIFGYRYRYGIPAFFYENFISYDVQLPKAGEEFVVHSIDSPLPRVLKHVIKFAFPEYKIVTDPNKKPNLIIKGVYRTDAISFLDRFKYRVPYASVSAEKQSIKFRRYLPTGYPFFEFVTNYISNKPPNSAYIPFAAFHKPNLTFLAAEKRPLVRLSTIKERYNVAYISRHCVSIREKFFTLLKSKIPKTHAHGKCSNNVNSSGNVKDTIEIYKNYNFVMAMENDFQKGYITEKIINAYEAQAIPIYWGDSKAVKKYFNSKSFIDVGSFSSLEAAAEYIKDLSTKPELIQKMLSEPILTKKGIALLTVNNKKLNSAAEKKLKKIAGSFRYYYLKKAKQKNIFLKVAHKIKLFLEYQ